MPNFIFKLDSNILVTADTEDEAYGNVTETIQLAAPDIEVTLIGLDDEPPEVQLKNKINQFTKDNHDFIHYLCLVMELVCVPNNYSIDYDVLTSLLYEAYLKLPNFDPENFDCPYDFYSWSIKNDDELKSELSKANYAL